MNEPWNEASPQDHGCRGSGTTDSDGAWARAWLIDSAPHSLSGEPTPRLRRAGVNLGIDWLDLGLALACAVLVLTPHGALAGAWLGHWSWAGLWVAAALCGFVIVGLGHAFGLRTPHVGATTRDFLDLETRRLRSVRRAWVLSGLLMGSAALMLGVHMGSANMIDGFTGPVAVVGLCVLLARATWRAVVAHRELRGQVRMFGHDELLAPRMHREFRRSIVGQVVALSATMAVALVASGYAYHLECQGGVGADDQPNRVLIVGHGGNDLAEWLDARGFSSRQVGLDEIKIAAEIGGATGDDPVARIENLADLQGYGFVAYDLTSTDTRDLLGYASTQESFVVQSIGDVDFAAPYQSAGGPVAEVEHPSDVARKVGLLTALYAQPRLIVARRDCINDPVFGDAKGCRDAMAAIDRVERDQLRLRGRVISARSVYDMVPSTTNAVTFARPNEVVRAEPIAGGGLLVGVDTGVWRTESGGAAELEFESAPALHILADPNRPLDRVECLPEASREWDVDPTGSHAVVRRGKVAQVVEIRSPRGLCTEHMRVDSATGSLLVGPGGDLAVVHRDHIEIHSVGQSGSEPRRRSVIETRGDAHVAWTATGLAVADADGLRLGDGAPVPLDGLEGELVAIHGVFAGGAEPRVVLVSRQRDDEGEFTTNLVEAALGDPRGTTKILAWFDGDVRDVRLSIDGGRAVASRLPAGGDHGFEIYGLDLDGSESAPRRITDDYRDDVAPRLTLDGHAVLFDTHFRRDGLHMSSTRHVEFETVEIDG